MRLAHDTVTTGMRLSRAPGTRPGSRSAGIGSAANRRRANRASHRAHSAERRTRALSVAMPVFAYIWRYSLEISTNASRARRLFTKLERCQTSRQPVEAIPDRSACAIAVRPAVIRGCGV